jgi:hypothetical protein
VKQHQAIALAQKAAESSGSTLGSRACSAIRKEQFTSGLPGGGWLVFVPVVVPAGLQPDEIAVEVADTGDTFVRPAF